MGREIKFRGQRIDSNEWVCGYIHEQRKVTDSPKAIVISFDDGRDGRYVEIIPETVGQYTGLKDVNGNEIYEGDFCKGGARIMEVVFKQEACQYWLTWIDNKGVSRYEPLTATYGDSDNYFSNNGLQIIGNIYE